MKQVSDVRTSVWKADWNLRQTKQNPFCTRHNRHTSKTPGSPACNSSLASLMWNVTWQDSLSKTILRGTLDGGRHPCGQNRTGERTSRSGLVFPSMTWSLLSKTGVSLSTVDTIDILIIPLPQRLEKRINKSISLVKLYSLPTPNFPRTQSDTACSLPPNTIHYMAATRYAG